jgi:RNA polymerase sigma-70 factor (ECF subfamily)
MKVTEMNHQPAFLFYLGDRLTSCMVFDISPGGDRILRINSVVDPEKLKNLRP